MKRSVTDASLNQDAHQIGINCTVGSVSTARSSITSPPPPPLLIFTEMFGASALKPRLYNSTAHEQSP